jgi:acylphosphatase
LAETPDSTAQLKALVRGLVQGVSFRYFTMRRARDLQLKGYVRNLPNGNVEVVAEGNRDSLQELLAFLRRGPLEARVDEVETEWDECIGSFEGFQIRR